MIGALAGIVGMIQAMEVVKVILGIGEPLYGKLALYDGLSATIRQLTFSRRPDCEVCGD